MIEIIKEIFMKNVFSSFKLSVVIFLLFILTKPITKRYTAGFRYYSWLVVMIVFLIPFESMGVKYEININHTINDIGNKIFGVSERYDKNVSSYTANEEFIYHNSESNDKNGEFEISEIKNTVKKIDVVMVLAIIWLFGVFIYFILHFKRYVYYKRAIKRVSVKLDDMSIYNILEEEKEKLNISKNLQIRVSGVVDTPMLIGLFHPEIVLPSLNYTDYEIGFILRHELFHLKRKDILYQLITLIFISLHWFNPVAYLMAGAIEIDGETSCDEKTIEGLEYDEKIFYGDMLIKFLKTEAQKKSYMTTTFFGGKNGMKKRLTLIADKKAKIKGTAAMMIITVMTVIISISVAAMNNEYFGFVFEGDTSYLSDFLKTDKKSVEDERFILTLEQYLVAKGHIMIICSFEAKTKDAVDELNAVDERGNSTFFDMNTISINPSDYNKANISSRGTGTLDMGGFDTKNKKYFVLDSDSIVNEEKIDFYLTTDKIKNSPKITIPMDYNMETKIIEIDDMTVEYSPISIVFSYPKLKRDDDCDFCEWDGKYLYFRMKNGDIKTFNQLYEVSGSLYDSAVYGVDEKRIEKYHIYAWARKIIQPNEIKSIIINDIEYPVDNLSEFTSADIDDSMKPFIINSYFKDGLFWIPLKEFCDGLGLDIEYNYKEKSAKFEYDNSEYIITAGKKLFLKDGKMCDFGDEFGAPFINEKGQMIVPISIDNYAGIDYMYVDFHLMNRFLDESEEILNTKAKWHVIP